MCDAEIQRLLTQLNLGKYCQLFKDNNLTDDSLQHLQKDDLIHVVPVLGDRILIWNGINKLQSDSRVEDDNQSLFTSSLISNRELLERGLRLPTDILLSKRAELSSPSSSITHQQLPSSQTIFLEVIRENEPLSQNSTASTSDSIELATTSGSSFTRPVESSPSAPIHEHRFYNFDIDAVLRKNDAVKHILFQKIPAKKMVVKDDRQTIAAVLVDAIIENLGTCPSKQAMDQMAKDLVGKYPALGDPRRKHLGYQMWFMGSSDGSPASGFLEERLKNQRKKISDKKLLSTSATKCNELDLPVLNWISDDEDDDPDPEEGILEYIRQNFGTDVDSAMKNTVFQRRTVIRRLNAVNVDILDNLVVSMPRLFDTEGMITQDFDCRHPALAFVMYDRWPRVSRKILEYAEESGIDYLKKFDDVTILAYCVLPFVLPSCGRRAASDNLEDQFDDGELPMVTTRGKRKAKAAGRPPKKTMSILKASDLDVYKSMFVVKPKNTHVAEILKMNTHQAPFLLALGTMADLQFDSFFIIIHKVAIPCGSKFLKAFDSLTKIFTVLPLPFPVESFNHWLFIYHGVFGKPCQSNLPPVVQALIGQIMQNI
ncbi:uncharacterized protein LOC118433446 isoform X2 [Folsomia candida]|uniref:uncharacterized protein LOC118433446 isoform X2 n=2 Tax=Folsomia candida TaxID=158441 RepID=UPI001604F9EB|nr:uncharacterized protein LOC118433446 isoform X2 [Folsomia candida]